MTARRVAHATFSVTRDYAASPARVFAAHVEEAAKRRWFVEGEGWETFEYRLDVRAGGSEFWRGAFQGGPEIANQVVYIDVIENERLIFCYEMSLGGERMSASLATIEITPHNKGARLTFTEQGAYLDGFSDNAAAGREEGTRELLEKLAAEVEG